MVTSFSLKGYPTDSIIRISIYQSFKFQFVAGWPQGQGFELEISLGKFNEEVVIHAMEQVKRDLLYALDNAKAELEFLEWLPSNAENVDGGEGALIEFPNR